MTPSLSCAECLLLGELTDAVTVYRGTAVCGEHLADIAQDQVHAGLDLEQHVRHALRGKLPRAR